jgi:hypothetical protein
MRMGRRVLERVVVGLAVAAALAACTQESEVGVPGEPLELAAVHQPLIDACVLLDQPLARRRMSGSFETHLLRKCGRIAAPAARSLPAPLSGEPAAGAAGGGSAPLQNGGADILVNDPALDTGGTTQSETSVVAHGNVVCVAWNDAGEGFGLNGFSGFGFSLDGGRTFTDGGPFPDGPGDSNGGDPSLAYSERDGRFYYAALSSVGLSMWQSSDDCQSFAYVGPIHLGFGDDKELIAVDNSPSSPHFGRIYAGWTDFALGTDSNVMSFSDDSGASWSAPVSLPGSGFAGQGMWPAVAPNGDAYVALVNRSFELGGRQDQWLYKATGDGTGWQKLPDIGSQQLIPEDQASSISCGRQALTGDVRNLSSPQIGISPDASSPAGYVIHATYPYDSDDTGPDHSNVFYRRSVDGGQTWSDELLLNDDGTSTDQFFPALGVDVDGTVVVSWYDRRLDLAANLAFDRFVTYSTDGGFTWTPNERLSDVSSPVAQTNPNFDSLATCYHGDYDQVATADGVAHVVWSDDRRITVTGPNPDVYYDQVALNPSLGRLNASPNPVSCDGTLQIRLTDADLIGVGSQNVSAFSTSGDIETVTLLELAERPGSFTQSILTASGAAQPGDGVLQLQPDDAIALVYFDEDTGEGESEVISLDVGVDCTPPEIASVTTTLLGGSSARIDVVTDEPSSLKVDYGFSCGALPFSAQSGGSSVTLDSLVLDTTYFFTVTVTDRAGNVRVDDNGGACYQFTTPAQLYFEDFEDGLGGFEIDNSAGAGNGLWHLSTSCASVVRGHSRPQTLYYGQDATCTYANGLNNEGVARSPVIALASTEGAAIEFNYFLGTEGGGFFDQASIAVSVNGGPFQIVESNFSALFVPVELRGMRIREDAVSSGGEALVDNSGSWQHGSASLGALLEGLTSAEIQLEFRFATIDDIGNDFAGFYVDDVRVLGTAPPVPCNADADCDDGLFCNGAEACVNGTCDSGTPVACAPDGDGVDCTLSRCDEAAQGCVVEPSDDACDDGAFCNGAETCDALAGCQPGTAVTCDDGIECTLDQCREDIKACGGLPQPDLCDDAVFCNGFEICDLTLGCIPGPLPCDDGAACSTDVCIEELFSCEWVADDALCNDGLFCNGAETCQIFAGCAVGAPPCSGDESCDEVTNQCALACVTAANGEHAVAARARVEFGTVYLANGSDDFLGVSADDVTSLSGGGTYWERVDSCSAAPVIESLAVQVVGNVAIVSGTASDANGDLEQVIVTFDVFGIPFQVPAQGTSEFSAVVPGFFPGQYSVTAQAFDESGLASAPSNPVIFQVLSPVAPSIDSIEAVANGSTPVVRGTASDPNGDIEKVIVTVLSNGVVVDSAESSDFDPFEVTLDGLPPGVYTARAQAVDMSGLASTLSPEVSFVVEEGAAVQCITATNAEHQAAGRAIGLFGDVFFLAVGSNDFLGIGGSTVTSLSGSGQLWEHVDGCAIASPLPAEHVIVGPTPAIIVPRL